MLRVRRGLLDGVSNATADGIDPFSNATPVDISGADAEAVDIFVADNLRQHGWQRA